MKKAVDVAEKNMSRFGLSQAEISNRRKWVMQTRKKVSPACRSISAAPMLYPFLALTHFRSTRKARYCFHSAAGIFAQHSMTSSLQWHANGAAEFRGCPLDQCI